jgi:hypothetical protein
MVNPLLSLDEELRIVVFDDCKTTIEFYRGKWAQEEYVRFLAFRQPQLDEHVAETLHRFYPNVIVSGLMQGDSIEQGFTLFGQLQEDPQLSQIPIVVVSKYVGVSECCNTPRRRELTSRVLDTPGVVAAFDKVPDFGPDLSELVKLAGRYELGDNPYRIVRDS